MKKKYLIVDTESNGPEAYAEIWQIAWATTDAHANTIKTDGGYLQPHYTRDFLCHNACPV